MTPPTALTPADLVTLNEADKYASPPIIGALAAIIRRLDARVRELESFKIEAEQAAIEIANRENELHDEKDVTIATLTTQRNLVHDDAAIFKEQRDAMARALEPHLLRLNAALASEWTTIEIHDIRESVERERDTLAAALAQARGSGAHP